MQHYKEIESRIDDDFIFQCNFIQLADTISTQSHDFILSVIVVVAVHLKLDLLSFLRNSFAVDLS